MLDLKSLAVLPSKMEAKDLLILVGFASLVVTLMKFGYRFFKTGSIFYAPSFPVVGKPGALDFRSAMEEGNRKYPTSPYIIPFQDPTVIIPVSCIEAIKNLPDDKISTNGNIYQRFATRWTNSGWVDPELQGSIRYDLTKELNNLYPIIEEEIDVGFKKHIGECAEWTSLEVQTKLVSVVAQVTGRVFVGLPLGRDPKWLKASIEHSIAVVMFAHRLRVFPILLRPLIAPFLTEGRTLKRSNAEIASLLTPIINAKIASANGADEKNPDRIGVGEEDSRLINWLLERYKTTSGPRIDPSLLVRDHFTLCFAAIHSTNYAVVQALFDLAAYPEYIEPLREEINKEAKISINEPLNTKAINKLLLLDSFCKESSRKNPQGMIAWLRKAHKPITLETGHVVPANMLVATCSPVFNNVFENCEKFDGYRFVKLRSDPNEAGKCNFSSTSTDSLIFGYGAHSCPGRVFGTSEVKMILAYILLNFDIRLPNGASKRPEGIFHDFMIMLPQANIELKARNP